MPPRRERIMPEKDNDNITIRIGHDENYPTDDMLKFIIPGFLGVVMLGKRYIKYPPFVDYNLKLKDIVLMRDMLNQVIECKS